MSSTRRRIGPPAPRSSPFYCPWCKGQINDEGPHTHSYKHSDVAPYAHLVTEEFWPAGTAAHLIAEGVV